MRSSVYFALGSFAIATSSILGCGSSTNEPLGTGGSSGTGGKADKGGVMNTGGNATGGTVSSTGGSTATTQTGGAASGGKVTGGSNAGGTSTHGTGTGGTKTGGAATGGSPTGGALTGGTNTGGTNTGGTNTGGTNTGGTNTGGDSGTAPLKPRVVALTDLSPWETDDHESLIRFLVHADMFEIEAIMLTTGYSYGKADEKTQMGIANTVINAYEKDLPNLLKRSGQTGHSHDSERQRIGYWPSADYIRGRLMMGSLTRGKGSIGNNNDSKGSAFLIQLAKEEDDRPIWVGVWGGGNTMCQAVHRIKTDSPGELSAFLKKMRFYTITDQDKGYQGEPLSDSCHGVMRGQTGSDLLYIWDECAWKAHNGTGVKNWSQYAEHIQNHGSLGSDYPKYAYGVEGDTPSFLYVMPTGLNDPNDPAQSSWGGTYKAEANNLWRDAGSCGSDFGRFYPAAFNNFAARMDWAKSGTGNRNPVIVLNGEKGAISVIKNDKPAGTSVTFDASATFDPDGNKLTFKWWTQFGNIEISGGNTPIATVKVPSGSAHLILEVTDDGVHNLSAYRRIVF